jgi:hypothetical protein
MQPDWRSPLRRKDLRPLVQSAVGSRRDLSAERLKFSRKRRPSAARKALVGCNFLFCGGTTTAVRSQTARRHLPACEQHTVIFAAQQLEPIELARSSTTAGLAST